METIELVINNKNYKGTIKGDGEINLTQIDNKKYFEEWLKNPKDNKKYQNTLMDNEYEKVIKYICEKENGILSGCYPTIEEDNITIHYDMKIEISNSKK